MTVRNDIINSFKGFSMAMYSTWLWHRPTRSMFDAGEGISLNMRNHVFAIDNVFLTHGHHDHLGGLTGLALARGTARGDKEKPFSVYHPSGWSNIDALKNYIREVTRNLKYDLRWETVEPDQDIQVDDAGKLFIRAFRVNHSRHALCLGYSMVEKRVRLRSEFVGKPGREIAEIVARNGRDYINEPYEKIVMAYTGDCSSFLLSCILGANVLYHEATFVGDDEMDPSGGHSTVSAAVHNAKDAGVEILVLFISPRGTMRVWSGRLHARLQKLVGLTVPFTCSMGLG